MSTEEYEDRPGRGDPTNTRDRPAENRPAKHDPAIDGPGKAGEWAERDGGASGEPRIYSDEWWQRFAARNPQFGDTVEKLRDTLDYGWRLRRDLKRAEARAAEQPARRIDPSLGRVRGRAYRQVNVKLGEPDFAALRAIAIDRDLPPATLARMLLRGAIRDAAG